MLTKIQQRYLDFIKNFYSIKGYFPSLKEIGDSLKVQPSSVWFAIRQLERKGCLEKPQGKRRVYVIK